MKNTLIGIVIALLLIPCAIAAYTYTQNDNQQKHDAAVEGQRVLDTATAMHNYDVRMVDVHACENKAPKPKTVDEVVARHDACTK